MLNLSAKELARQIRERDISSIEATQFFINRIEAHNESINAVIAERFSDALINARLADDKVQRGEAFGPLHGVPMTIKDAFEVTGLTCEVGYPAFKGRVSQSDAAVVQRLQDAGAIILGKTNTPLLCADLQTYNAIHGTTNNPHNHSHTPGGSSGGSAAALASGMTPLEFGSDIGGSIRTPANFCGLFGHKPTFDIIPQRGHVPPIHGAKTSSALNVVGPLARSMDDLELAFDITLGLEGIPARGLELVLPSSTFSSTDTLKVGLWLGDDYCPVEAEIIEGIKRAGLALESAGASVEEAKPDFQLAEHHETYVMHLAPIIGAGFDTEDIDKMRAIVDAAPADDKSPNVLQARGTLLSHAEWLMWNEIRAHLASSWDAFFARYDVVLCPITPTAAMPHDQDTPFGERVIWVNGEARPYSDNVVWAGVATLCGLPSTAVPLGKDDNGLPFGVQVIGPAYGDRTTLAVAKVLEGLGYRSDIASDYC